MRTPNTRTGQPIPRSNLLKRIVEAWGAYQPWDEMDYGQPEIDEAFLRIKTPTRKAS